MWDRERACKMLSIPYKVYNMSDRVGGYSNLKNRYIHISTKYKDNDRVWIHEIAHTLCHFQHMESAAGVDINNNAYAEMEADTVAYIVCRVLGIENTDYKDYMKVFMSRLPLAKQTASALDNKLNNIKKTAVLILNAGGYYGKYGKSK